MYSHLNEPIILQKLSKYDFVLKLVCSFKDYDNIYLVTSFYDGKSLFHYRNQNMSENELKFVSACIIQSLEYLRDEEIIHRDVMMKNIIMDKERYYNLIDFSSSVKYSDKSNPKYYMNTYLSVVPPEMLNRSEYDYNSDYYRLGSILYYLIFKEYPNIIKSNNNITIFEDIYINQTKSSSLFFLLHWLYK